MKEYVNHFEIVMTLQGFQSQYTLPANCFPNFSCYFVMETRAHTEDGWAGGREILIIGGNQKG